MRHASRWFLSAVLALITLGTAEDAAAQNRNFTRPNIFFDCGGPRCDFNYYRTEIGWVNWVRDRRDADLHVIMTSVTTGAGGREYQLDFTTTDSESDYLDQLFYAALSTDTDREQLDGVAHTLALGLARFANAQGFRGLVTLHGAAIEEVENLVSADEVDDPWNLWVFRIGGNGNLDGESRRETIRLNGDISASRVTPTWKTISRFDMSFNRVEFELEDGTFSDERYDWGFNQLTVRAIADHWSLGLQTQLGRAVRFNQGFRAEVTPALEYSVFPYEEATRKSFTFFYKVGPAYRDYLETTIFNQEDEIRWEQAMEIEFSSRQTWGRASASVEGSHFLHDFDRNRLSLRGNMEIRIVRGLSLNWNANIAWVDDQIYLPTDDATDEEALLRLQQQATSFDYGIRVGFSFQFGSIFNNVVNNRFGPNGFRGFF